MVVVARDVVIGVDARSVSKNGIFGPLNLDDRRIGKIALPTLQLLYVLALVARLGTCGGRRAQAIVTHHRARLMRP